jgi:hypothetical protein
MRADCATAGEASNAATPIADRIAFKVAFMFDAFLQDIGPPPCPAPTMPPESEIKV